MKAPLGLTVVSSKQRIEVVSPILPQVRPQRVSSFLNLEFSSLLLAITQEVPKLAGVNMMLNVNQKPLIELKGARELFH